MIKYWYIGGDIHCGGVKRRFVKLHEYFVGLFKRRGFPELFLIGEQSADKSAGFGPFILNVSEFFHIVLRHYRGIKLIIIR